MSDPTAAPLGPKILDRVRIALRTRHYSPRTEEAYVSWCRRYTLFHHIRHPAQMGPAEVAAFVSHLAVQEHVSASTQNQALSALLFLYEVLGRPIGRVDGIVHAKRPKTLPVVLTRDEIRALLTNLHGTSWLVTWLLYGTGLRLFECLELRVKDIDVERCQVVLRRGKGQKDRVTVLPSSGRPRLEEHFARVRRIHERDLARGLGAAPLPDAVGRTYPNAARDWRWQCVFPAARICRNPRWGPPCRFHLHASAIQRDVAEAVRAAGISKHATVYTMRHSFATHLLADGYDIRSLATHDTWFPMRRKYRYALGCNSAVLVAGTRASFTSPNRPAGVPNR